MTLDVRLFVATKALIRREDKILLLRESDNYIDGLNHGKYALPGGRINPGEKLLDALKREIAEETGLVFQGNLQPFYVDEFHPKQHNEQWQIVALYYLCDIPEGDIILSGDHDEFIWIAAKDHASYLMASNLRAVFEAYQKTA